MREIERSRSPKCVTNIDMLHAGAGAEEDQNWHIEICVVLSFLTWGFAYKPLLLCSGFLFLWSTLAKIK